MKLSKISMTIGGVGIATILAFVIKYFFMTIDVSQLLLGGAIGSIFVGLAFIYSILQSIEKKAKENEHRLNVFAMWWTGQSETEVENQLKGRNEDDS